MIVRNSDNVVLYNNEWQLKDDGAFGPSGRFDGKVNTSNATEYQVPIPEGWIGGEFTYDGSSFELTEYGVSYAVEQALNEINLIRGSRLFQGVEFTTATGATAGTHVFTENADEITTVKIDAIDIKLNMDTFENITGGYWKSNDNVEVEFTEAEFLAMSVKLSKFLHNLTREMHKAKKALKALPVTATKADVDAIVNDYKAYDPMA